MDLRFRRSGSARRSRRNIPASRCAVERSGAERVFQRIGQEYSSQHPRGRRGQHRRRRALSSSGSATAGSRPICRRRSRKHYDKAYYDADGLSIATRILVSPIAYNTNLVKKEDAPKSFADLLDPKWAGKMVKAHPAYSGTIMNATFTDRARPRLGVFREARQAEGHAGAVGDRHAEEDRSSASAP